MDFIFTDDGNPVICCGNCAAFRENPRTGGQGGDCHYNPPQAVVMNYVDPIARQQKSSINTVFPPVPKTEMCFKFMPHVEIAHMFKASASESVGSEQENDS